MPIVKWFVQEQTQAVTTTYQMLGTSNQIYSNEDKPVNKNAHYGYLSNALVQGETEVKIDWHPFTLGNIITSMGGTVTGIFGMIFVVIGGY